MIEPATTTADPGAETDPCQTLGEDIGHALIAAFDAGDTLAAAWGGDLKARMGYVETWHAAKARALAALGIDPGEPQEDLPAATGRAMRDLSVRLRGRVELLISSLYQLAGLEAAAEADPYNLDLQRAVLASCRAVHAAGAEARKDLLGTMEVVALAGAAASWRRAGAEARADILSDGAAAAPPAADTASAEPLH